MSSSTGRRRARGERVTAARGPRRKDAKREAVGVLLGAVGLFLAVAFVPETAGRENLVGPLGAASFRILTRLFSWGGLVVPVLALVWAAVLVRGGGKDAALRFSAVVGVGALACLTAFALLGPGAGAAREAGALHPAARGGMLALELATKLRASLGLAGALIVLLLAVLVTVVLTGADRSDPQLRVGAPGLSRAYSFLARLGRGLLWTAGVVGAAALWLVSWAGGLLGLIGIAVGAARSRLRRAEAAPAVPAGLGAEGEPEDGGRGGRDGSRGIESQRTPGVSTPGLGRWEGPTVARPVPRSRSAAPPTQASAQRGVSPAASAAGFRPGRKAPAAWEVPLDLFDPPAARDVSASERELQEQGRVLIRKLADFNVRGEVVAISSGPVITQFEVEPAPGVKVNQIANLADDLALAMRAQRIRIVAPIPGKGAVGIEIPNARPERVTIRELLTSPAFRHSAGTLPIVLGKEISGTPVAADLTRMPHLLIAGSTGSGKSVCINVLLTSLLYRFAPEDLRLVLVDPKMLELSMYNDVPHLLHPVVTRPREAAVALKWAVYEMERRFELLARNTARNIGDFNARLRAGAPLEGVDSKLSTAEEPPRPLPYVVVIVDELADLMLTVQAEIEEPLARLAQKARAVGIHVVLATQRPSVNVLTGFIKANFPSRISFQVASKTDSRTVLDQNGAEALLGSGDMLFLPADRAVPIRIQGAFVSSGETEALVEHLKRLARERGEVRETIDLERLEGAELQEAEAGDRDELFYDAARVVIEHDQGSTSLLQRRLKVGYSRAARIIDQLERGGIVGPADGSKPREVRLGLEELAEMQAGNR